MKKVLIIVNICKDESLNMAESISEYLKSKGIQSDYFGYDGFSSDASFEDYSLVITLGGDGTVLYAARNSIKYNIPVFPINLGQFGFIAAIPPEEWKTNLDLYLQNKAVITERNILYVELHRQDKLLYTMLGLNDVVLSAQSSATTISLNVEYNDLHLCNLRADGLIVATPTGSTAYSASAGGPILSPDIDAFVMTPLNAFSLSSRPIVLNANGVLSIKVEKSRARNACIVVDGQEPLPLLIDDKVIIKQNENKIRLVCSSNTNFYNTLRSKLNWTGGPHA